MEAKPTALKKLNSFDRLNLPTLENPGRLPTCKHLFLLHKPIAKSHKISILMAPAVAYPQPDRGRG